MSQHSTSLGLFEDSFMYSTSEKDIEAMNDTARGIVMLFRGIGIATGDDLLSTISESVSP